MNVHDAVHVPWPAELQQEIQKESAKYIRHSLRSASATPGQALSAKDAAIPQIISAHYAEIDRLAAEKEVLAERMVQLIMRARARLDYDLNKVLVLQGELDPSLQAGCYLSAKNPADKINESLRNAIAIPEAPASPAVSSAPAQKRRRVTTTASAGSIKLPSPAPMIASSGYSSGQRSRLSQQVHPRQSPLRSRRVTASAGLDADEDAEGEDDLDDAMEEGGDAEDKELYCFCQKLSYGEMIACDNPNCRYQWFHLPCVNLKPPLPENWYCEECMANMKKGLGGATGAGRKGRKK
ncbi:hypothetical protein AcW1_010297 [Taiwanofungus camphoratus]|nr:hypothetical protein AcW2_010371 [Antrodia cinnamomea]KAI0938162.1 hypothetical protein AcV7_010373 [Antrodia cinnamomea]KAI0939900.1 hypothetical protein AcV5_010425 [Antrodia cinnamomea]KAI0960184.1 hypothetical protein AcW1_010297 [Antrodia cinnamomea]